MGAVKFFSSSSNECNNYFHNDNSVVEFSPSPKIENYDIIKFEHINNNLIILINYKDVDNYEGNKILVYKNCMITELKQQKLIDPHFAKNKTLLSPIARFEPTDYGWELAKTMANLIK